MLKLNFSDVRKSVLTVIIIAVVFAAGYGFGYNGFVSDFSKFPKVVISRQIPADRGELNFSLFWRVWDTLNSSYYDKTKLRPANMVYGAISGMVAAVGDPYTTFLPPAENKIINDDLQGSLEGIGIQVGFKGTNLAVIAPLPGSPAQKAGMKAGDLIAGIKDEAKRIDISTSGISLQEAITDIRGPAGSKVTLTLVRDGVDKPMVISVVREKIDVPSVVLKFLGEEDGVPVDKSLAYIQLLKFGGDTNSEWTKAVTEVLKNEKVEGVILDVRNNPGGYMQGAVDVAGDFLPSGSLVVVEQRGSSEKAEYKTSKLPLLSKYPLIILVNGGSASASEILAGSLRDDVKIQLVGDKTFGKGTIQEPQDLDSGAGLHVTIAKWLTPKGIWVHEKGLEPDVKIADDANTKEDEQLQKAIQVILRKN